MHLSLISMGGNNKFLVTLLDVMKYLTIWPTYQSSNLLSLKAYIHLAWWFLMFTISSTYVNWYNSLTYYIWIRNLFSSDFVSVLGVWVNIGVFIPDFLKITVKSNIPSDFWFQFSPHQNIYFSRTSYCLEKNPISIQKRKSLS